MERLTSILTITNRNCTVYLILSLLTILLLGCSSEIQSIERVYYDPVRRTIIPLPNYKECVKVVNAWVKNEGKHADIYGNADCKHYSQDGVICNDMTEGDACAVGRTIYTVQGEDSGMVLNQIEIL